MFKYLTVSADLAGFAQYFELQRGDDGLWVVTRQVDDRPGGPRRYGRGSVQMDDIGMLSDQPSTDDETAGDEFTEVIDATAFEERWHAAGADGSPARRPVSEQRKDPPRTR